MPGIKNRKGEIQVVKKNVCSVCENIRKHILFLQKSHKKKKCVMCDCGVFSRDGEKIQSFT